MKIKKLASSLTLPFLRSWLIAFLLLNVFNLSIVAQELKESNLQNIPFSYDEKDFGKVEVKYEKKITSEDESVKLKFPIDLPAHNCVALETKRPLPALEKGGRYFFPAQSFICFIPTADSTENDFAKAYPNFSGAVIKLRNLLKKRPSNFKQFEDLFDVPYNNAGWSFKSKIQYLDYKNVLGVFFLTQYSQDIAPNLTNNEELTANFQGLTKNGSYYVAARFSVTYPTLPKGIDFTDSRVQNEALGADTIAEMNQKVRKYLQLESEKIEKLDEDKFQPSIKNLKKLISSIDIR